MDREALRRLVASVSRFLEPAQAVAATAGSDVEIIDSRRFGGAFVLDQLWERLGIGPALRRAAAGRRLDAGVTERVLFALVANRCLEPSSKLAACRWVIERVAILPCPAFDDDAAYAAMDFLLAALGEIAGEIFARTANLLNLSCDVIFAGTSSTCFEVDVADELAELATALGELALLLIRTIEYQAQDTWRNIRHELDRMHLVTLQAGDGRVAQRSVTTPGQQHIFKALRLTEPARFHDFELAKPAG